MLPPPSTRRGFSLVEVVIAIGVFAVAVGSILALLPTLSRQESDAADLLRAQRLPDLVRGAIVRQVHDGALAAFAASVAPLGDTTTFSWVAARDGLELKDPASASAEESYFLVELWQFSSAPLQPTPDLLPLAVRVSWPYRLPGAVAPSARSDRGEFNFVVAINR